MDSMIFSLIFAIETKNNINMMKRTLLLLITTVTAIYSNAQLTLDGCKQMAHDNYPAIKQYRLIEQSRDYSMSNASKGYLPQINASAGANIFADILDIPQEAASQLGSMKNELYSVGVQINQVIYDGGNISAKKKVTKAQADVQREQLNVTMYDINSRVEQLYFGLLMLDEQIKQNHLLQHDLGISKNTVTSMMTNGTANQSDVDAVSVEEIKAKQSEGSLKTSRKAYLKMLETFIGEPLSDATTLEKPTGNINTPGISSTNNRPELEYYAAKGKLLDEQRKALNTGLMPKLNAFGIGMYHNKVIGMMKNELLAAGLSLSWNIGSLYTRKNDISKIETERQQIAADRETFLFNTGLQSESSNAEITNLQQQITLDEDIINLRESIRSKAEKKVMNGTETVNEMLRDINSVNEARQTKAIHEIQLTKEIYNLKNINNN